MERQAAKYAGGYFLEGPTERKVVALTFDDGPAGYTVELLKVLNKHGVKATFFWKGDNVEKYPGIAKEAAAQGHTIGNHSYSHPHCRTLGLDAFWNDEVGRTQTVMEKTLGFTPSLFRPPYGELNDEEIELLREKGIKIIGWSVDPKDWSLPDDRDASQAIVDIVLSHVHPEAIVLMHDGALGHGVNTVRATDEMIPLLKARGYEFVTVDRLLGMHPGLGR